MKHIFDVCKNQLDQDFSPKRILDFGCGTGRLGIPFVETAEHVVGLDSSDSMLKGAYKNCKEYSLMNVSLFTSDDNLSALNGCFDFIHSFIPIFFLLPPFPLV